MKWLKKERGFLARHGSSDAGDCAESEIDMQNHNPVHSIPMMEVILRKSFRFPLRPKDLVAEMQGNLEFSTLEAHAPLEDVWSPYPVSSLRRTKTANKFFHPLHRNSDLSHSGCITAPNVSFATGSKGGSGNTGDPFGFQ